MNEYDFHSFFCKITFHRFKLKYCRVCNPLDIVQAIKELIPTFLAVGMAGFVARAIQDKRHLNKGRPRKRRVRR